MAGQRSKLDKPLAAPPASPVHPAWVPAIAQRIMPEDTVWVLDGGNTVVWSNFHHEARVPRSVLSTFKFGMLGAGMGQALGAAVAAPDRRVVCLIGDGAFGMHATEIESAVRLGLPIVFVVLVDGQWGMVKMSQQIAAQPRRDDRPQGHRGYLAARGPDRLCRLRAVSVRPDGAPDGCLGAYVDDAAELEAALEKARDCGGPAVVHVAVDNVEHMWAPGLRAFKKMHTEPKG